ncbi:hypothetical protein YC2023_057439 [Brassica napus]
MRSFRRWRNLRETSKNNCEDMLVCMGQQDESTAGGSHSRIDYNRLEHSQFCGTISDWEAWKKLTTLAGSGTSD